MDLSYGNVQICVAELMFCNILIMVSSPGLPELSANIFIYGSKDNITVTNIHEFSLGSLQTSVPSVKVLVGASTRRRH